MTPTLYYIFTLLSLSAAYLLNNKNQQGVGIPFNPKSNNFLPNVQIFSQKLDHFNPTDETSWSQRYWRNPLYYISGGPAFLMINGEGPASAEWAVTGQWVSYAETNNAMCFLLEHRYYGKSWPTRDTSTENLRYLSSEQALADMAYFIKGMTKKYNLPKGTKWIVFGGSYSGSLAAWLRMKYPYLVHGAVSSSGPLLAKIDFYEYFEVVRNSISSYNEKCVDAIKQANDELKELLLNEGGRSQITDTFQLCDKLENNKNDISSLIENLAGNLADVVQYNKDNRKSETKFITIDLICDIMTGVHYVTQGLSAWKRYAAVNRLMLNAHNETCLSYKYDKYIKNMQKVDWESSSEYGRQWIYQTCTEFGFYQTSTHCVDIFGQYFPAEFFIKQCRDIFGSKFNDILLDNAVNRTNILYGALDINVGNIIFIHGSVDPWHALGITSAVDEPYEAVFINGTAHCADMYPSSDDDTEGLKMARIRIRETIKKWLNDDNKSKNKKKYHFVVKYIRKHSPNLQEIFIDEFK